MSELQIFAETSSVLKILKISDYNLAANSWFQQITNKTKISSLYKWSASSVAGKNAKVPIYILAQEHILYIFSTIFLVIDLSCKFHVA